MAVEWTLTVPLVDLPAQYAMVKDEMDLAVSRVIERGNYVMGPEVEAFEEEWALSCGARYCVATSSGTDALYLAFQASKQDVDGWSPPVVIPTYTFVATYEAAHRAGRYVYLVDVDENTGVISADSTRWAKRLCCFAPVHLHGYPADIPDEHWPNAIEDAAQSHGQLLRGRAACHSFYPTKPLGAMGQAGAVVTDDKGLADTIRILRCHGEHDGRFHHVRLSGNYRMDELQAAVLRAKLPYVGTWTARRREIARYYNDQFTGLSGVTIPPDHPLHVWHIYPLRSVFRSNLAHYLGNRGIETAVRYPFPIHLQPCYEGAYVEFPNAEGWAEETLSLPLHESLTDGQVEHVVQAVKDWSNGR